MTKLFISYSHSDRLATEVLIQKLQEYFADGSVWSDINIIGGQDWKVEIHRQISFCDVFVYIASNNSKKSLFCKEELNIALGIRKPIIPLLIDNEKSIPRSLSKLQYIDFRGKRIEDTFPKVVKAVLEHTSSPSQQSTLPVVTRSNAIIPVWTVGVVILIIIILSIIFIMSLNMSTIDSHEEPISYITTPDATGSAKPTLEFSNTPKSDATVPVTADTLSQPVATPTADESISNTDKPASATNPVIVTNTPPIVATTTSGSAEVSGPILSISVSSGNVRKGPDTNYDVIKSFPAGTSFEITGRWSEWYEVKVDETTRGWVRGDIAEISTNGVSIPTVGATPELPSNVRVDKGVTMVLVPGGCFNMGSTPEQIRIAVELSYDKQDKWFLDEQPSRQACSSAFWIDQTEVTNRSYRQCVNEGICTAPGNRQYFDDSTFDNYPVIGVTWYQADQYARWRSAKLPTEVEWEYAARGPNSYIFPWGNTVEQNRANFCDAQCFHQWRRSDLNDGFAELAPVGQFSLGQSWVQAVDMSGNAWEWTSSPYDGTTKYVTRGGSYLEGLDFIRAAKRSSSEPTTVSNAIGFRCVKPA